MSITRTALAVALGAALWTASPAGAQTFHLPAAPEKGVWMEASYADLKPVEFGGIEVLEASFPTTTWFLSGRVPINDRWRALVDVPFAHARASFAGGPKQSSSVLGNPYLGVEYLTRGSLVVETGVRLPLTTADEESFADVVAFLADFQRGEAFLEDVVPVSGAVTYEHGFSNGMSLRGRTGVVGLFYTGEAEDVDNEALIDYGLLATYPAGHARFGLGLYGRWWATELFEDGGFSDNSVHHASLSADYQIGRVRPGVSVRMPLDSDYDDVVKTTVGLYVQVPIR